MRLIATIPLALALLVWSLATIVIDGQASELSRYRNAPRTRRDGPGWLLSFRRGRDQDRDRACSLLARHGSQRDHHQPCGFGHGRRLRRRCCGRCGPLRCPRHPESRPRMLPARRQHVAASGHGRVRDDKDGSEPAARMVALSAEFAPLEGWILKQRLDFTARLAELDRLPSRTFSRPISAAFRATAASPDVVAMFAKVDRSPGEEPHDGELCGLPAGAATQSWPASTRSDGPMDRASVPARQDGAASSGKRRPGRVFRGRGFNAAPFIEAAIASALAQTGVTIEVIVVDDASSDDTPSIVAAVAARDPRVTLIRRTSNGGPSVSRNEAMRKARGAWIAVLDADDLIAPERPPPDRSRRDDIGRCRGRQLRALLGRSGSAGFDHDSAAAPCPTTSSSTPPRSCAATAMFDAAARLGYIKLMFRRAFLESRGIEHLEEVMIGEDYHLGLSCLLEGARFVVSSETLYKYRVRDGSLSWRLRTEDIEQLLRSHDELGIERRFGDDAEVWRPPASIAARSSRPARSPPP